MKRSIVSLVSLGVGLLTAGAASAQLSPLVSWSGNTVYVKTYTPSSPQYRCDYSLSATFADGSYQTVYGQTDPPTGGSPISAVTWTFNKTVANANVSWNCRVKS